MSQFLHPGHVYSGWIESYFIRPWLRDCTNYRDGINGYTFGMAILAWLVVTLGLVGILMGSVGLLGPEIGFGLLTVIGWVWGIFSLASLIAMCVRLGHGVPNSTHSVKMLPIDWVMIAMCLLFFIFGLLMMLTTLNSEILRPDPGVQEETQVPDSIFVTEEPIFTYQEAHVDTAQVVDTMSDLSDPDLVSPDESFDPTLSGGESPDDPAAIDTTQYF